MVLPVRVRAHAFLCSIVMAKIKSTYARGRIHAVVLVCLKLLHARVSANALLYRKGPA